MDSIKTGHQLMENAQIIFWDFDGVIKDSVEIKTMAFVKLFESYGQDMKERVRQYHEANGGMSRFSKFPVYLKWIGEEVTSERVHELSEQFSKLVFQGVIDSPWVSGVEEYLRMNKYRQTFILVSATPQGELEQIVDLLELKKSFTLIFGAPTSKAEAIRTTLLNSKVSHDHALMIGDASADLEAAQINRVPFLLRRHSSNAEIFADYGGVWINDFIQL